MQVRRDGEWVELDSEPAPDYLDDMERIAWNIARLRKRAGMSQEALARAMVEAGEGHWRQTTVSRVERGKQELNPGEMAALGGILGGDVMAGTHFSKTMRGVVSSAMRGATRRELAKIERSLRDALDALEGLRKVYEAEDDGEHRETH